VNVEHGRVVTTGIVPFTNTNRQLHPSTNSSSPDPAGDGFTPRSSSTTRGSTGVIGPVTLDAPRTRANLTPAINLPRGNPLDR
jgi:hypothetical protein